MHRNKARFKQDVFSSFTINNIEQDAVNQFTNIGLSVGSPDPTSSREGFVVSATPKSKLEIRDDGVYDIHNRMRVHFILPSIQITDGAGWLSVMKIRVLPFFVVSCEIEWDTPASRRAFGKVTILAAGQVVYTTYRIVDDANQLINIWLPFEATEEWFVLNCIDPTKIHDTEAFWRNPPSLKTYN